MNFFGANNQETIIFKHSLNNQITFSGPQFIQRQSYNEWFNGTNDEQYEGFRKLTDSNWSDSELRITQIALEVLSVKINGAVVFTGTEELFVASSNADYEFSDEGYGFGFYSYIDALNSVISNYGLQTRFYPSINNIVGIINTSENFEVNLREVATLMAGGPFQNNYSIKCEYGNISDGINGYFISWG
jgi:hypothetical protein